MIDRYIMISNNGLWLEIAVLSQGISNDQETKNQFYFRD